MMRKSCTWCSSWWWSRLKKPSCFQKVVVVYRPTNSVFLFVTLLIKWQRNYTDIYRNTQKDSQLNMTIMDVKIRLGWTEQKLVVNTGQCYTTYSRLFLQHVHKFLSGMTRKVKSENRLHRNIHVCSGDLQITLSKPKSAYYSLYRA